MVHPRSLFVFVEKRDFFFCQIKPKIPSCLGLLGRMRGTRRRSLLGTATMRAAAFSHLTFLVILCHCASAVSSFGTPRQSVIERFDYERTPGRPRHTKRSGDSSPPRLDGHSSSLWTVSNALTKLRCGDATPRASPVLSAASSSELSESSVDLSKYHLIWSPYFAKRLVFGLLSILLITKVNVPLMRRLTSNEVVHHACHSRPVAGIVLPLLSSSCCALQLAINAVSGLGCAGFNTILGELPATKTTLTMW